MVRLFDWDDLARLDETHKRIRERAEHDPQWAEMAEHSNIADKVRAEGSPRPLGTLELLQDDISPSKLRFDVDSLFCGTSLKNGMMPAGAEGSRTYTIGPNVTWGPPGVYRFVWRAAQPKTKTTAKNELLDAVSNPVEITVTD
jgi:hypothetical protein